MKKKIFTFMLALMFFIPCLFALTACGEDPVDPPAHVHAHTHGLCDCGDYKGTTISAYSSSELDAIAAGETAYYRFRPTLGQHYEFSDVAPTVKMYGKYNNNWSDLSSYLANEFLPNASTVDGYVYLEMKNETNATIENFDYTITQNNHIFVNANKVEVNNQIELDETMTCIESKTALEAGETYKVTITSDDYIVYSIANIYDTNGAVEYTRDGYAYTFTVAEGSTYYFHVSHHGGDEVCFLNLQLVV